VIAAALAGAALASVVAERRDARRGGPPDAGSPDAIAASGDQTAAKPSDPATVA
jgi:hypothetical protein